MSDSDLQRRDELPGGFLASYRRGELGEFFDSTPGAPGALQTALEQPRPVQREALIRELRDQAARFGAPAASLSAIDRLAHPEAKAVVTGQQAGLLLGPSYTLSKAVSAVHLARRLDTPERPVVPVFWIASQDHDAAEVDHAWLLDQRERLMRVTLDLPPGVPVGRVPLADDAAEAVIERIAEGEWPEPRVAEISGLLRRSADGAGDPATWFGRLLAELIGPAGLIVFDPLRPGAARLAAPALRRELDAPDASVAAIRDAGERLEARGWDPQLGRADDATNLFLERPGAVAGGLPERALLRRVRPHQEGAEDGVSFLHAGAPLSRDEIEARLDDDPACLTPAAGLRPVVQDSVLPTAATVVGPGELRYIAQLRGVYHHHGVAMPLIWPRAEATVLEPPVRRILARYELTSAALQADAEGERDRIVLERAGHAERFRRALANLERERAALAGAVERIDPTLVRTVEKQSAHVTRAIETLRTKSARALADRDATTRRQFERLERHLLPNGAPQERVLSPFSFMLKFGVDAVVDAFASLEAEGRFELEL